MKIPVLILDGDPRQGKQLVRLVSSQGYPPRELRSWEQLPETTGRTVLLVNLDTVKSDNRDLLEAAKRNPGLIVLTLSQQKFHPELSRAMQEAVFASLCQPLDQEELLFWLRSIGEMDQGQAG